MVRILIIATTHDKFPTGEPTGLWAEELITPYYVFEKAGAEIVIATPKGGKIPIEPVSLAEGAVTDDVKKYLGDVNLNALIENTLHVKDVTDTYDAVFVPGGHGVVFDVPTDETCIAILEKHWAAGKVLSAVCHGPGALVNIKTATGDPVVKGKKVAGFSNSEEEAVGKTDLVPFLLEDKLSELGGLYEKGPDFKPYAVGDGKLVTGQNPASSAKVAQLTLEAIA